MKNKLKHNIIRKLGGFVEQEVYVIDAPAHTFEQKAVRISVEGLSQIDDVEVLKREFSKMLSERIMDLDIITMKRAYSPEAGKIKYRVDILVKGAEDE